MREYAVAWTDPAGVTRQLGRVTAHGVRAAARLAYQRHPFLPPCSMRLTPLTPTPEPRVRGFTDPVTAQRAARLAQTPEAQAKRRASRDARPVTPAKPLTLGQRKWRDLARRRKRTSPRRATHDEG